MILNDTADATSWNATVGASGFLDAHEEMQSKYYAYLDSQGP